MKGFALIRFCMVAGVLTEVGDICGVEKVD